MRRLFCFVLFCAAQSATVALAQPTLISGLGGTAGYGTSCLGPNDDGSSALVDITTAFPGGLEFFGRRHASAYVNTNGNITFSAPLWEYTPESFPIADQPMIAPYWADVDIRYTGGTCNYSGSATVCHSPTENGVWWHLEPGRMVVTWDRVGYYGCNIDRRMTFQLILTESRYCGVPGDFDVEFRYTQCEWETGDASGGSGGFGGTPAQVGFDAGNLTDFVAIPGSLMSGISNVVCNMSNVDEPGVWRFRIRRGVVECPDAGEECTIEGALGVCAEGRTQCVGTSTACMPLVEPGDERCDAFDNDCDGTVDEGDALCPGVQLCERGRCIDPCFEGGCPAGHTCSMDGRCVEDACAMVTCDAGQRCVAGSCLEVCDGVVCPAGQSCVAGRCSDLCATVTCGDACEVCIEGDCRTRCEVTGCPAGQACEETGVCVPESCLGVRCGPGRTCRDGVCADACVGTVCPMGEVCERGACIPAGDAMPDGGVPPDADAGTGDDAGTTGDGGVTMDAGGGGGGGGDDGCGCSVPGASRDDGGAGAPAIALLVLGLFAFARRRRAWISRAAVTSASAIAILAILASGCGGDDDPMTTAGCGDGMRALTESCDDGNTMAGDGCSQFCSTEPGFRCEGSPSVCVPGGPPGCGDMRIDEGEQCDDGGMAPECDGDCTLVECGDGWQNAAAGEECDDGNTENGDGCTARCLLEPSTCNDGTCGDGETCTNCIVDCADVPPCNMCPDMDGDGAPDSACGGTDCNDFDENVHPGATEVPCNMIDEDCSPTTRDAEDADRDGSSCNFDCDDANAMRAPLFLEQCNDGIDNDCDETTADIGDFDRDGFMCNVDCDDYRATTCPTCPELCNNTLDDDCNPATPDLFDTDTDGYTCDDDCDDANVAVNPGATEICANGADDDCDAATLDMFDLDGDGDACNTDCADRDPLRASSFAEICGNVIDDDCSAATPDLRDADMDSYTCDLDCADMNASIVPDAAGRCGPMFTYAEGFETGDGGWTASGTASSWARGMPTGTFINAAAVGSFAWVTNPAGSYNNNELSYLTSPPLDLSTSLTDVMLSFRHIFETESCCDGGWVEMSTDGGTTWRKVGRVGDGLNWYNNSSDQWRGTSGMATQWRTARIPLRGTAGRADVRIRFAFDTDGSVVREGFGVDDVRLDNQTIDLALAGVGIPAETCRSATHPVAVTVKNVGIVPVRSFQVGYTLGGGGSEVVQNVTRTLIPGQEATIVLSGTLNLAAGMSYSLSARVIASMDSLASNDSQVVGFSVVDAPWVTVAASGFTEGFESGTGGFVASGTASSWSRGTPGGTYIPAAGTGSYAWVTNPTGSYNNNEMSYLSSPCYDLRAFTSDPTLSFQHIFQTEAYSDEGWIEVAGARGATAWTKLGQRDSGTNWYTSFSGYWHGNSAGGAGAWRVASHVLTGTAGQPVVRFRHVFSSDGSIAYDGFGVDQVSIAP